MESTKFHAGLGFTLAEGQKFRWSILEATGANTADRRPTPTRDDDLYEARLGWAMLLSTVIEEGTDVKGGGTRFELIVPNERFVRDPLLPDGAPSIPSAKGRG